MPPEGVPFLGSLDACEEIIRDQRPTHVVIGMSDWDSRISPSILLKCRLAGTVVEDAPAVYERLFHRVSCQRLQPMDLLLSSSLRGDSRTMAIQAIYTNLIGLSFLIALSPVLLLVSFAIALSSGGGPVFESVDCAGLPIHPLSAAAIPDTPHRRQRPDDTPRPRDHPAASGKPAAVDQCGAGRDGPRRAAGRPPGFCAFSDRADAFLLTPVFGETRHPGVGATPSRRRVVCPPTNAFRRNTISTTSSKARRGSTGRLCLIPCRGAAPGSRLSRAEPG